MPNRILIVESDAGHSKAMRSALERRGFAVEETNQAKEIPERLKTNRPDILVLAVDLAAGQNGYIICGKLKKDADLKSLPIVIVGNPEGFAKHHTLKTRADAYVAKPINFSELLDRVAELLGLSVEADESISGAEVIEELELEEVPPEDATMVTAADPDVQNIDAAFDGIQLLEPSSPSGDVDEVAISVDDGSSTGEFVLPEPEPSMAARRPRVPPPTPTELSTPVVTDSTSTRELRAQISQLGAALAETQSRVSDREARIRELEAELAAKQSAFETARSSGGKHDKDFFALREASNNKDKEVIRLKRELNDREKDIVVLRDRENALERDLSERSDELSAATTDLKALSARLDVMASEKKRLDQQLTAARDEAHSTQARLTEAQSDLDQTEQRATELEKELTVARALEHKVEELSAHLEAAGRKADALQAELDATRTQLMDQAGAFAAEASSLRKRISEVEKEHAQADERISRLVAHVKNDQSVRERTRKALLVAAQLLDEHKSQDAGGENEAA